MKRSNYFFCRYSKLWNFDDLSRPGVSNQSTLVDAWQQIRSTTWQQKSQHIKSLDVLQVVFCSSKISFDIYMDVSENSGFSPPNHPFSLAFPWKKTKTSILEGAHPYFSETPQNSLCFQHTTSFSSKASRCPVPSPRHELHLRGLSLHPSAKDGGLLAGRDSPYSPAAWNAWKDNYRNGW